jgi:AraC-like DNA-binding protein
MLQIDERPVLACRVGQYARAPPIPELCAHFQCIWTNSVHAQHARRVAVVPDGCVDLLWRDNRFAVVGPDVSAANPVLSPGSTVLGIRFRPGAAAKWLRVSLTEIVGHEVSMAEIWGREANWFGEVIGEAPSVCEQALAFQQLLAGKAAAFDRPPREASAIFEFLRTNSESGCSSIASLCDRLNTSKRTLRRRNREFFGYGPKTLDRILRFQRFQALAVADAADGLAVLASRAGYADQAHLAREMQALCGMTAGEFVRQLTG